MNYSKTELKIHRLTYPEVWFRSLDPNYQPGEGEGKLHYTVLHYDEASGLCAIEASSPVLLPGQMLFRLVIQADGTPEMNPVALLKPLSKCQHAKNAVECPCNSTLSGYITSV